MNERIRLYLRLFLWLGISFGITMGFLTGSRAGLFEGIINGVLQGAFYGGFMSLICGTWHISKVRKIADVYNDSLLGVRHEREVLMRLPYGKALDICTRSIHEVKKGMIADIDPIKGLINARRRMSWSGFGDKISVTIESLGSDLVRAKVSSRPILWSNLIDDGSNLDNVQRITKFLEAESKLLEPAPVEFSINANNMLQEKLVAE